MIVYISIGNSDDKLSQAEWCQFVDFVDGLVEGMRDGADGELVAGARDHVRGVAPEKKPRDGRDDERGNEGTKNRERPFEPKQIFQALGRVELLEVHAQTRARHLSLGLHETCGGGSRRCRERDGSGEDRYVEGEASGGREGVAAMRRRTQELGGPRGRCRRDGGGEHERKQEADRAHEGAGNRAIALLARFSQAPWRRLLGLVAHELRFGGRSGCSPGCVSRAQKNGYGKPLPPVPRHAEAVCWMMGVRMAGGGWLRSNEKMSLGEN